MKVLRTTIISGPLSDQILSWPRVCTERYPGVRLERTPPAWDCIASENASRTGSGAYERAFEADGTRPINSRRQAVSPARACRPDHVVRVSVFVGCQLLAGGLTYPVVLLRWHAHDGH